MTRQWQRILAFVLFLPLSMAWGEIKPTTPAKPSASPQAAPQATPAPPKTQSTPDAQKKPEAQKKNDAAKKPAKKPSAPFVPRIFVIPASSSLYSVKIMVMAGSVDDPMGKEGVANLTARALLEGGFGDAKHPVTKEQLAEITRPWGAAAMPSVQVDKQTTTFSMLVPKEAFPRFVKTILQPMFSKPLFQEKEIDRLRTEAAKDIQSGLRLEDQETLGLQAIESYLFAGTALSPLSNGTVQGLKAIQRADLLKFYRTFYNLHDVAIATSADDESAKLLRSALPLGTKPPQQLCNCDVQPPHGREMLIVTQPNAIATGIHLGFPLDVQRNSPDYWPLFVANTYLGTHRDEFGRLYHEIRETRGYNYGDYSYIEYLSARPFELFPPPDTPRSTQYFSIWIRPVGDQYAHFVLKAATAELERFVREGMTPEQVEEAKVKARTLYLKYAENVDRQLGYRLDDTFYGMDRHGYLQEMLQKIDAVNADLVNAVIRHHLQTGNLRYVITTNEKGAEKLADDIAQNANCTPKTAAEYHLQEPPTAEERQRLAQDQEWIAYPLNLPRAGIHVVKSSELFETAAVPGVPATAAQGAAK